MFGYWKRKYQKERAEKELAQFRVHELRKELELLRSSQSVSVGNHTLTRDCFTKLKKKVSNTHLSDDTSAGAIGYKLGVAHAMDMLESTHVV